MNILIRKLIFNEADIHIILWNGKPCFFVSELSKALDSVNKEDIPVFLRNGEITVKGIDYDVVNGPEARELKACLENSGIKKRFVQTMIIYFDGLRKYFNYRKTIESKDFISYLEKCKITLEDEKSASIGINETITPPASVASAAETEPKPVKKHAVPSSPENKPKHSKKKDTAHCPDPKNSGYSEFLKHISFMEEFVDTFNKVNIPADKSVVFTKSMVKFLEDNGIDARDFLNELKKWTV